MFRVVLDANQFVSALLNAYGFPTRILNAWRDGAFELAISSSILEEIRRVLNYPRLAKIHKKSAVDIDVFLEDLRVVAYLTPEILQLSIVKDPDDNKYLVAAVESEARFLVTGDSDLLRIIEYENVRIVAPREFVQELKFLQLLK